VYPYAVSLALPYWTGATYRAIFSSIFSGSVVYGPELHKLESVVIQDLGVEDAVLCGSGSLALEIALRACGVGKADEVVIPTFCCTAIVPPILAAGAIPVLADVGDELNITAKHVAAALTEKTIAIIVPHLFGNPADIEAIVDLARGKNIRVIDDAAQALGATIDGRPAGSFGDAGILSFGYEKVCSGLGGGIAVSTKEEMLWDIYPVPQKAPYISAGMNPDPKLSRGAQTPATENFRIGVNVLNPERHCPKATDVSPWYGVYLRVPGPFRTLHALISTLFWRRWRRWTRPAQGLFAPPSPDSPPVSYRQETMANLNAAVALTLLRKLQANLAARRERVSAYQKFLGGEKRLQLVLHRSGSACLTQVVRVIPRARGDDPAVRVIEALRRTGFEVQGSYVPIHLLSPYKNFARIPLPHAEGVWADLVELPCEPDVSFDHVERIAAIVRQVVDS
jgi:dTDP-4-amino-4,6-dideoxygalactose transaminase